MTEPARASDADRPVSRARAGLGLLSLTAAFVAVVMAAAVLVHGAVERFRSDFIDIPISTHQVRSGEFEFEYLTGFELKDPSEPSGSAKDFFIVTATVDFDLLDRMRFTESVSPQHLIYQRIDRAWTEFFVTSTPPGPRPPSKEEFFAAAEQQARDRMEQYGNVTVYLAEPTVTERVVDGMPALDIRLHQKPIVWKAGVLEQQEAYLHVYNGAVSYRVSMNFQLTADNGEMMDRLLTSIRLLEGR